MIPTTVVRPLSNQFLTKYLKLKNTFKSLQFHIQFLIKNHQNDYQLFIATHNNTSPFLRIFIKTCHVTRSLLKIWFLSKHHLSILEFLLFLSHESLVTKHLVFHSNSSHKQSVTWQQLSIETHCMTSPSISIHFPLKYIV